MSISSKVFEMVDRLKRAGIDHSRLAFEVDENEWRELCEYIQGFARYQNRDLSYVDDMNIMGLHIRKRNRTSALPEIV